MNLENLNLVELNAQEVQEVEGGAIWWPFAWYGLEVFNNPIAHHKAFSAGYSTTNDAWN
ncbi:hypothetical protein [Flavobacterium xanthum]|uniref:Class IIb bacteriocin, lactobin A/cerein 7B family n=1 Tax=Flavobacterium xanthum TaxID=69322 RepID=A0A1M7FY19_9FLAO|nr:hypothetical protein [Flavobacterium xanthum]SHM08923.1 hypothetical protein SAMN05443669_102181 [Flavobacterium xanthum]